MGAIKGVRYCQVVSVSDDTDSDLIKVKILPEDSAYGDDYSKLPYAFPLLPKMLHVKPKVGEGVFVFLTEEGKTVFYMSYEEHLPYYENIHRLLPNLPLDNLSYVDHKMLFDKEQLKKLHEAISHYSGKPWLETAIESYDRTLSTPSAFSEFEIYGNFVQDKVQRPWLQKRLPYSKIADYETLQRKWSRSRWSLTFPDYINKK